MSSSTSIALIDKTIRIEGLTITAGTRTLLRDTNITLASGNRYGIIAKNGLGKSTFLAFLFEAVKSQPAHPTILCIDQHINTNLAEIENSNIVDVVIRANEARWTLIHEAACAEAALDTDATAIEKYNAAQEQLVAIGADRDESLVKKTLRGLGFSVADLERPYKEFSGGWRRRIMLARALYLQPEILLADEITNDLDLGAIYWLSGHLSKWRGTLVIVSHNIGFLDSVCTHMLVFERAIPATLSTTAKEITDMQGTSFTWGCKIKEYKGNYSRYMRMSCQTGVASEKSWNAFEKEYTALKKAGKKAEVAALVKKRALEGIVRPETLKRHVMCFPEITPLGSPIIQFRDVQYDYAPDSDASPILTDINMRIDADSRITIVGPNGAGKTTLLKLIVGELDPTWGEIDRHAALKTHYFNQQTVELLPIELNAIQYIRTQASSLSELVIRAALGRIGLEGKTHEVPIGSLSGGQRVRVALASFMVRPAHLLVFDEVTNHLDIEAVEAVRDGINEYEGAVVIVSHDSNFIEGTKCKIWRCESGTVSEYKYELDEYLDEMMVAE